MLAQRAVEPRIDAVQQRRVQFTHTKNVAGAHHNGCRGASRTPNMAGAAAGSGSVQEATDGAVFSSRQAVLFGVLYLSYLVNVMSQSSLEVAMPLAAIAPAVALCAATHSCVE